MRKIICLTITLLFLFSTGCATTSRIVHYKSQPKSSELFPDDEDIAKVIEEAKNKPAPTTNTIKWNGTNYEVSPDAMDKIMQEKIYFEALKKKVKEFSKDYDPITIKDAARQDMGTMIWTILLVIVGWGAL